MKEEDGKRKGKSGPTAGNSDPAEPFPDVTGLPRDVLVHKDADASVGKSQQDRADVSDVKADDRFVIPPYFSSVNSFAALAVDPDVVTPFCHAELDAIREDPRAFERKTPKQRGRPRKPVDQQPVPTPRTLKEHRRRPPKERVEEGSQPDRDTEDWMYDRAKFLELNEEYGPFSLDAAASSGGENAQCKRFCSKDDSFLQRPLHGETVWANFPYQRLDKFLDRYLEEKQRDPTNSGMFVLPKWTSTSWWSKVEHMDLVREHPAGEQLFTAPPEDGRSMERRRLGPTPWPVCVFWDPPRVDVPPKTSLEDDPRVEPVQLDAADDPDSNQATAAAASGAAEEQTQEGPLSKDPHGDLSRRLLIVHGRLNGKRAKILIDSGSQLDLVDSHFKDLPRGRVEQGSTVSLAGGQQQDASVVTPPLKMELGKWSCQLELRATALEQYDVILGKPWLTSANPQISWRHNTMQLWTDDKKPVRVGAKAPPRRATPPHCSSVSTQPTDQQSQQPAAAEAAAGQQQQQQPEGQQQQQQQRRPDVQMVSQRQLRRIARHRGAVLSVGFVQSVHQPDSGDGPTATAAQPRNSAGAANATAGSEAERDGSGKDPGREARSNQRAPAGQQGEAALAKRIEEVADEYPDVFQEVKGMPPKRDMEHKIELEGDGRPPFQPVIRLSPLEEEECKRQLAEFCSKHHTRPSQSPFGAPVLFAQKKGGGLRFCIDYRRLNQQTKKDRYPMPRIDELLDRLLGAKVFTKLDLQSGYHQVRIAEEDIHKTAFRTRFGHYEFTVMPFGLTNAPATFQRMMNSALAPFIDRFVVVYLDDILIFSRNEKEHEEHVRAVLEKLREEKLFCRKHKCEFGTRRVEYLGHMVGPNGVEMNADKVRAVQEWPIPKTRKELKSFLGLAGYYRRFIKHYAQRAHGMSELLKGDSSKAVSQRPLGDAWTKQAQASFVDIKAAMTKSPCLAIADPDLPYKVYTDSSAFGTGAVLLQDQGKGLQPCAYLSHKLSSAEQGYAVHEQELLGIINALKAWRPYLEGARFHVNSDHKSLMELKSQPKLSRRQARWVEFLQAYDCKVDYVAGEHNHADALSRRPDMQVSSVCQPAAGSGPYGTSDSVRLFGVQGTACALCAKLGVRHAHRSAGSACGAVGPGTLCARGQELRSSGEREVLSRPGVGSARPASHSGGPGTACAHGPELRSSGACPGQRSARPASDSGVPETSCAHGAKLGSSGVPRTVDLMAISVLDEDNSFSELVRQATRRDAYPAKDRQLTSRDGMYYLGNRLYVPPPLRRHLVEELHASAYGGHFGADRTIDAVTRRFYWPHIKRLVRRIVGECSECQRSKPRTHSKYGPLQPIPVPSRPWEQMTLDLVTELPETRSGYTAVLTFVDRLSKMVHWVPCTKTLSAEATAHIFKDHVFRHHGLPEVIIGDRDRRWSGLFWSSVFRSLGTKVRLSTAYHPQTDGQSERANRTMEEVLRSYVHPRADDWDQHLIDAEFAYNSTTQRSTGRSPFYTAYGYHPRTPADLYNPQHVEDVPAAEAFTRSMLEGHAAAKAALEQAQQRQMRQYDKRTARTPFKEGSWALLESKRYRFQGGEHHKLRQPWLGPYRVRRMVGPNAAELELPHKVKVHPVINVSRLKAYKGRADRDGAPLEKMPVPETIVIDDHEDQEDIGRVEQVLAFRDVFNSKKRTEQLWREYLVKFQGLPLEDKAWINDSQFNAAADAPVKVKLMRAIAMGTLEPAAAVYRAPSRGQDEAHWYREE